MTPEMKEAAAAKPEVIAPKPECLAAAPSPDASIKSKPGYTQMRAVVTDADGNPIRNLTSSDFIVSADSKPLPVVYSAEEPNGRPASVMITIDTSGSMQSKLLSVHAEFEKLLGSLNSCDDVGLIAFSGRAFVLQKLTMDHHLIVQRLTLLHAMGPTSLYDAIHSSAELLEHGMYPDHVLIVVTDGKDNTSGKSVDDVIADGRVNHVQIYLIGIGNPASSHKGFLGFGTEETMDKGSLDKIALSSGGEAIIVPDPEQDTNKQFAHAISKVEARLDSGYEIGFIAPEADVRPKISIAGHPDYQTSFIDRPVS